MIPDSSLIPPHPPPQEHPRKNASMCEAKNIFRFSTKEGSVLRLKTWPIHVIDLPSSNSAAGEASLCLIRSLFCCYIKAGIGNAYNYARGEMETGTESAFWCISEFDLLVHYIHSQRHSFWKKIQILRRSVCVSPK